MATREATSFIIARALYNREISERDILLLKRRANEGDEEAQNFNPDGVMVSEEQSEKGYKWLMNLWKTPFGKERATCPFTDREKKILEESRGDQFTFCGFKMIARAYSHLYVPIYDLNGLTYYVGDGFNFVRYSF